MIEHVLGVGFIIYAGLVLFDRRIERIIDDARWEMRSHERGSMEITIQEGVGLIPIGARLVWEHHPGGKLAMWEDRPRDQYHPLTILLTRETSRRLISKPARAWRLKNVDGLRIEIAPIIEADEDGFYYCACAHGYADVQDICSICGGCKIACCSWQDECDPDISPSESVLFWPNAPERGLLESSVPGRLNYRSWVRGHVSSCKESRCKVCTGYSAGFEDGEAMNDA